MWPSKEYNSCGPLLCCPYLTDCEMHMTFMGILGSFQVLLLLHFSVPPVFGQAAPGKSPGPYWLVQHPLLKEKDLLGLGPTWARAVWWGGRWGCARVHFTQFN